MGTQGECITSMIKLNHYATLVQFSDYCAFSSSNHGSASDLPRSLSVSVDSQRKSEAELYIRCLP